MVFCKFILYMSVALKWTAIYSCSLIYLFARELIARPLQTMLSNVLQRTNKLSWIDENYDDGWLLYISWWVSYCRCNLPHIMMTILQYIIKHVIEKNFLSLLPNTKKLTFLILPRKKVRSTDFRLFEVKDHQRLVLFVVVSGIFVTFLITLLVCKSNFRNMHIYRN